MTSTDENSIHTGTMMRGGWLALLVLVVLSAGCASAGLSQSEVVRAEATPFRTIILQMDLADPGDSEPMTRRLIRKLDGYDLQVVSGAEAGAGLLHDDPGTALLTISEVERRLETIEYRQTYGRTSLTQMRGRKSRDVPVITLRATFEDAASGQALFTADYVAQGPWHADSASVVASLAGTLVEELENNGFIAAR